MKEYKRRLLLFVKRVLLIVGFGGWLWALVITLLVWPATPLMWLYAVGIIMGFVFFFFWGVVIKVPLRVIVVHEVGDIRVWKKPPDMPYLDPTESIRSIMNIAGFRRE